MPETKNGDKCPSCGNRLDADQAVVMGRCRVCNWDLSLPDSAAKEPKTTQDPRRYQGPGRKR